MYPTPGLFTTTPVNCPELFMVTVSSAGVTHSPVTMATGGTVYPDPAAATEAPTTARV